VFGDKEAFFGSGHGDELSLYFCVDHAGFEFVVDGSVGGDALLIKFFIIFSSDSKIV
jgi:hypothetical protein